MSNHVLRWRTWRPMSAGLTGLAVLLLCSIAALERARADAKPTLEPVVVGSPSRVEVYPTKVKLDGARRQMHLIVTGYYPEASVPDARVQDLTRVAKLISTNPQIVRVQEGMLLPVGNGNAEVIVKV